MFPRKSIARSSLLAAAALIGFAASARAQFTFSIDYLGPTNGTPNGCTFLPIRPSDILTPSTGGPCAPGFPMIGPLPFPSTLIPGGAAFASLAIPTYGGCVPAPPGVPCPNEVDALSYGIDAIPPLGVPQPPGTWVFSVDEFATGVPGFLPPTSFTEGPTTLTFESCTDVFQSLAMPPSPMPFGPVFGNAAYIDGNGLPSASGAVYPGVGIMEPRPPMVGPGARPGDNIDALDVGPPAGIGGIYFSLDGGFPDPLRGIPNTGSAAANGFLPGAILNVPVPGAAIVVWAMPIMLGLDLLGPGTDDLDALALTENGIPFYQPGAGGDVVRFSVRRGSAVIGMPDSLTGVPIEPGDILGPPIALGMPPQLIVPAEALGLATVRSGTAALFGDDLDGLDALYTPGPVPPIFFCEPAVAGVIPCPCGNPAGGPGRGCNNTALTGGAFLTATGNASLAADTLVFTAFAERPTVLSILIQHTLPTVGGAPFGHGVRCMAGPFKRLYQKISVAGSVTMPAAVDPTISARSAALGAPIAPGTSRYYGIYYRDGAIPPCPNPSSNFNIGNQAAQYWVP